MSLATVVAGGVAVADSLTASLQETITHKTHTGNDKWNKPTYTSASVQAILERKEQLIFTKLGEHIMSRNKLTFPRPITVAPLDVFTLPDGTEPPILKVGGILNPDTSAEYLVEVWLG